MSDITIRTSRSADETALRRLAALDSQRLPAGELLVAEVCGDIVAAYAPNADRAIADPFRRTADEVELLKLRAHGAPVAAVKPRHGIFALPASCELGSRRPSSSPRAPAALQTWAALGVVYVVWGSTYLAIRVMVETIPPLLGAGCRFLFAGALMLALLAASGRRIRATRRQLASAALIGVLLPGANAVVSIAEVHVPSNLAALLIASVPLILIVLRRVTGDAVAGASYAGVAIGFAGVAVLLHHPAGASLGGMLLCIVASTMWASGSFAGSRIDLPDDVLVSTAWQMLLGGVPILVAGLVAGEHVGHVSGDSLWGFAFLVFVGSMVAYTCYAWLLRNVRVSKVATYAYVNPAVAIVLGWLILGETITATTLIGAAVIIASVALVVRAEASR